MPVERDRDRSAMRVVQRQIRRQDDELAVVMNRNLPEDGRPGPAGPTGPVGADGPRGPQGLQGPKGDPGAGVSILGELSSPANLPATGQPGDAWLINGSLWVWSASTTSWSNVGSIRGPAGPAGPQGERGMTGAAGAQGPAGETGNIGAIGPVGADGAPGPQGVAGPAGDTGPIGPAGAKGDTGATGQTGPTGPSGKVALGTLNITQTATLAIVSAGLRTLTFTGVPGALVGDDLLLFPTAALPAGYAIHNVRCPTNGSVEVTLTAPLLAIGASFSIPCRLVALR